MSGAFVIEEIESRDGLARVVVRLEGRALPEGGRGSGGAFEIAPGTRQSEHYYPQVNQPTRHLMGVRYEALTIHGRVEDRYLGTGAAKRFRQSIELLVNRPVRFGWGDDIQYLGVVDKAAVGVETERSHTYSITFLVDGPESEPRVEQSATTPATPADLAADARAERKLVAAKLDATAPYLSAADRAVLRDVTLAYLAATDLLTTSLDSMIDATVASALALGRASSLAGTLALAASSLRAMVGSVRIAADAHAAEGAWWQSTRAELIESLTIVEGSALATAQRLDQLRQEGDAVEVYDVREGDTLESIALRRLGDHAHAAAIARNNRLAGLAAAPGDRLTIPR